MVCSLIVVQGRLTAERLRTTTYVTACFQRLAFQLAGGASRS